jgi:hypothetical protein
MDTHTPQAEIDETVEAIAVAVCEDRDIRYLLRLLNRLSVAQARDSVSSMLSDRCSTMRPESF